MNKTLKIVLQTVLTIGILVLGYLVYESIMEPVRFNKNLKTRTNKVVQRLKDIRNAEIAYKGINDSYTGSFDTLINFVRSGEIPVVYIIQDPDDTTFTKTIANTIDYVNVQDSLFGKRKHFYVDSLRYIPFSNGEKFELQADTIKKGGVEVDVVEVKAHYKTFLKGLDRQLVINQIKTKEDIDKYPGLKFGSLKEPSTDGNWE